MADYYEILGISADANGAEIRAAYKKLAMLYHPDRNPGNAEAEEMFKAVNEAYHVLSDSLKRSRYDSRFTFTVDTAEEERAHWRDVQRQRYRRWQNLERTRYRFDKHYFKIQGLAFLVFLVLAGFCFAVIHTINYISDLRYESLYREKTKLIEQVDNLFTTGSIDKAFERISVLCEQDPTEFRFLFLHDSLLNVLRHDGERNYQRNDYHQAAYFYAFLKKYEVPQRPETLQRSAICEYHEGNFTDALQTLKRLLNQQPWNLDLVYQIAIINLDQLNDLPEALHYFTLGKKLFRENLTKVYGEAFAIVMNPADVPDIYFQIFEGRARTNIALKNYSEAVKDCNWAIYLRPEHGPPYKLRAVARVGSDNLRGICGDLSAAGARGETGLDGMIARYCR